MCELDHIQAHNRFAEYDHVAKNFNLNTGGSVPTIRDMHITQDSLGLFYHDDKLKAGAT